MKFRATVSFVSTIDGRKYRVIEGEEVILPHGADWVMSGLVVPVKQPGTTKRATRSRSRAKKKETS